MMALCGSLDGAILCPWKAEPYRLWSLDEMRVIFAHRIITLADSLDHALYEARTQEGEVSKEVRAAYRKGFRSVKKTCEELGLSSSSDQAGRIVELLKWPDFNPGELAQELYDLRQRFTDELGHYLCLILTRDQARFWNTPQLFGAEVFERFPAATIDIEEAGKCLACHRGTAAVYHLMRAMESGLRVTAKALEIEYTPNWGAYLTEIQKRIDVQWKLKTVTWKRDEPFFRDVLAYLQAVKVAWRNTTMHVDKTYTPEQAEEIFNAIRVFMRHLATDLPKAPARRKREA
jgi:hypothetical protein